LNPRSASNPDPDRLQFYGRRKGKALKAGRISLLESLLPRLRVALQHYAQEIDPYSFFDREFDQIRLEIGFGSGEHIAAQAAANPRVGFIGSEVFVNGVASLLRYAEEFKLANLRIYDNDVRYLLPALKSGRLARISLLFPDPWPKARHAKRRFVSPANLDEFARLLADGGELRIASDHPVYVAWTLQHVPQHAAFQWTAQGPDDWRQRPCDSTPSRYEEKAIAAGRTPTFLNFARLPRAGV
jgi:tRNA (guanine-N7-)-methyltransferase